MARFPFRPGAGAKSIKNPVYWSRLYLQETYPNVRSSRANGYVRFQNMNTNLFYFMSSWLHSVGTILHKIDRKRRNRVCKAVNAALDMQSALFESEDFSQKALNPYMTRIAKVMTIGFEIVIHEELFGSDEIPVVSTYFDRKSRTLSIVRTDGSRESMYYLGPLSADRFDETKVHLDRALNVLRDTYGDLEVRWVFDAAREIQSSEITLKRTSEARRQAQRDLSRICKQLNIDNPAASAKKIISHAKKLENGERMRVEITIKDIAVSEIILIAA